MKRHLMTMCVAVLAVSAALAQEKKTVPPPPKPADDTPTLAATMKFIQDKLKEQGNVSFLESWNNTITGEQYYPSKHSFELLVAKSDPTGGLSLNFAHTFPGLGLKNTSTFRIHFKDVEKLEVLSKADKLHREFAKAGTPEKVFQTEPSVHALVIYMTRGKTVSVHMQSFSDSAPTKETEGSTDEIELLFRDEDMANRVAKAMVHAVELCGGGSKPEPF